MGERFRYDDRRELIGMVNSIEYLISVYLEEEDVEAVEAHVRLRWHYRERLGEEPDELDLLVIEAQEDEV